jgi:hypothetical protein
MKVMDGTNRRSRGAGKAAVAHKRLQRRRGQGTRADYASNHLFGFSWGVMTPFMTEAIP